HIRQSFQNNAWEFGQYNGWYNYGNPVVGHEVDCNSYEYLPWPARMLGLAPYNWGIQARFPIGATLPDGIRFENAVILAEVVAQQSTQEDEGYGPYNYIRSVNYRNGRALGGNVLFGDGSVIWLPLAAYLGQNPGYYGEDQFALASVYYRK